MKFEINIWRYLHALCNYHAVFLRTGISYAHISTSQYIHLHDVMIDVSKIGSFPFLQESCQS